MKQTLSELDGLHAAIETEHENYKTAIKNDRPLEEVKAIYQRIKVLEKKADVVMQQAHSKLHEKEGMNSLLNDSGFMIQ